MAVIVAAPPVLSGDLSLFHTTDPLLANAPVLAFYGPAATVGGTSSRMQVHIFTPAGHASNPRLAVSPNSPFYSAVSNLPREEQGDEDCRALAFALKKYFHELPDRVKKIWCVEAKAPMPAALFGDEHVAILASRMTRVENVSEVIEDISSAFGDHKLSWLDVDVVLPSGVIRQRLSPTDSIGSGEPSEEDMLVHQYGRYAELVDALGDVAFLPTAKLKRAPSKPSTLSRAASFLTQQKENVRKQYCELLETETSYVKRLEDLNGLRTSLGQDLNDENKSRLHSAFPPSTEEITNLNTEFLQAVQSLFEATGSQAQADIEAVADSQGISHTAQDLVTDGQGVGALAKCMCDWFPKFSNAYGSYLQSHAVSAQAFRELLKDSESAIAAEIQGVGEQRLTSLLIEPVQRLPRYGLYIDSIIKQLPARHIAIKHLLKAREIVTEICDAGMSANDAVMMVDKLRSRISDLPTDFATSSRLVAAVDGMELLPPYAPQGCEGHAMMILLFNDAMMVLEKTSKNASTAKSILTEIESGLGPTQLQARPDTAQDLQFVRYDKLQCVDCLELQGGHAVKLMVMATPDQSAAQPHQTAATLTLVLRLEGSYERRAERFMEDLVRARVEGRFSEPERECHKWEARACQAVADLPSLFSAIFEDSNTEHTASRQGTSTVRIIVDIDKHSHRPRAGQNGLRTVVSLSPCRDGLLRVSVDSIDSTVSREHVPVAEVLSVIRRKLANLLCARFSIEQETMTACLLEQNATALRSISLQAAVEQDVSEGHIQAKERYVRPKSPKKLLSSLLSSTGPSGQAPVLLKKNLPPLPPPPQASRGLSSSQMSQKPPSRESRPPSRDQTPMIASTPSMRSTEQLVNPFRKLEDTLSTYLLALQARKGNIVGRSLKLRASANELAVNELYNGLLEDPNLLVLAAQTSVDVLFAAFEKFLNIAWREQIGQVLPIATLKEVQMKAETLFPADFDGYFKSALRTLPPQNQRAFKAIMKLLADLLDGTGNDGDRGILTAAFAEVLVTEGNPHDFIALIDRFVDDPDTYFGEPLEDVQKSCDLSNPNRRPRSVNSASISSNTSSLRKKFGFGTLSRENSKSEQESKVASVWRTLSKTSRNEASPVNSISRGSLYRSHSTDVDTRVLPPRPTSQGELTTGKTSSLADESILGSASSAQNIGLSTIGEHPSFIPTQPPRKKRRSSLSDLKALGATQEAWMVPSSRKPAVMQRYLDDKSLPASPIPSTPSSKGGSGRFGTPLKDTPRSRLPASFRKDGSPGANKALESADQRPKNSHAKSDETVVTAKATSGIPTLGSKAWSPQKTSTPAPTRIGLAERHGAGNIVKKPSPPRDLNTKPMKTSENDTPKKMRMQSPQKLRERLQNEHAAVAAAHASLQEELSKIGEELTSTTSSRIASIRAPSTTTTTTIPRHGSTSLDLAARVLKMESRLPSALDDLTARLTAIQSDLASSLTVSEAKNRKLDELYREANGENEALYARFNDELGRLLKAVKGGEGVEETKRKLKESQDEAAKLRRENGRLKREVVGLRAQLKE